MTRLSCHRFRANEVPLLAERDRLQPGKSVAAARAAKADRLLVADEPAATADPDGWPAREARPVLLAAVGRRTSDADSVRCDSTQADGALSASGVMRPVAAAKFGRHRTRGWSWCPRNRLPMRPRRGLEVSEGGKRAFVGNCQEGPGGEARWNLR
jgi:hypothetical protein